MHLKTHGVAGRQYKCPHPGCDKMFFSELTMGSHRKTHQRDAPIKCTFEGCEKVFDKPSRLTAHMRMHTGRCPIIQIYPGITRGRVLSGSIFIATINS